MFYRKTGHLRPSVVQKIIPVVLAISADIVQEPFDNVTFRVIVKVFTLQLLRLSQHSP